MPLTTLDPATALILIDLQHGIVALPTAHSAQAVVQQANALADAFRSHDLPVVLVNVAGAPPGRVEQARNSAGRPTNWSDLVPELDQQPQDHRVTKRSWGAFTATGLDVYLKQRGVTQVVIAGIVTSMGVESTARQAHELGYNVTLAIDAMTDTSLDAHLNSLTRIFPRISETGTTQAIIDLLGHPLA
jgi:nicotinamidase-related amidase